MNLNQPEVKNLINKWQNELRQIVGDDVELTAYRPSKKMKFGELKQIICKSTDVTPEKLVQKRRFTEQVEARYLLCLFAWEYLEMSLTEIAKELHYKDHTSVMSGIRKIHGFMDIKDERVCELVNKIESEINKSSDG